MHQAARLASDPATAIFAAMRTTASYDLFPDAPSERAMARARYLAREGRVADAEKAYRDVLREHPDLKSCWAECFELLRSHGRTEDALRLAEGARAQFGDSAFALALKGAALIDLERYREALGMLDLAHDSGWHFGQIVALGPALPVWRTMAEALGAPLVTRTGFDPGTCPLVVAQRPQPADAGWATLTGAVSEHASGMVFVLEHPADPLPATAETADVVGVLTDRGARRARQINVGHALSEAQHPAARLAGRRLARE